MSHPLFSLFFCFVTLSRRAQGPGAYFKMRPLGKSAITGERNVPAFSMRGREKFGSAVGGTAVETPGPGSYARVDRPNDRKAPSFSMRGRPEETASRGAKATPAPGRYRPAEAFGKQPSSTRATAPTMKFGKSERKPMSRAQSGVAPGQYGTTQSLGTQLTSNKRTAPVFSFGSRYKAKEFGKPRNGPGSYKPLASLGRMPVSTMRSAPSISMSGRTQFGSPYNV